MKEGEERRGLIKGALAAKRLQEKAVVLEWGKKSELP